MCNILGVNAIEYLAKKKKIIYRLYCLHQMQSVSRHVCGLIYDSLALHLIYESNVAIE